MAHEMEQSRKELAGEYERVQKKAFTNWVNSHLIKAGQKVKDLAEDFKDGTKLILLLELLTHEKLPRERGKMRVHKLQNVQNALDFLQVKRRIKLVNIRNDEIVDGNQKLILGLIWTLILHFQISGAIHDDDIGNSSGRPTSPQEISAKAIKDHLLHWAQAATEGYDEVKVTNFTKSWNDGLAFCAILDRHRPDLLDYDDCDPDKPIENLEKAFRVAEEKLDIVRIVDPEDVCVPKPDDKTIMTYLSFLHQAFPDMPPPRKRKGPLSPEEYCDQYDKLNAWVDEKKEQVKSDKPFPDSTEDLKKEIAKVEELKNKTVPRKKKDLDAVSSLHDQLQEQHKKKASNPGVPEGKELPKLEQNWEQMVQDVDQRHKDLLEELQRREGLGSLASKVLSKCEEVSGEAKGLQKELEELEKKVPSMGSAEITAAAERLADKAKHQQSELVSVKPDVETLKKGQYHDAANVDKKVCSVDAELESLLSRIADVSHAAGEAEVLTELETCLQELEAWLVSSGKFAPNQQILQQIQEHKKFEEEKLSKAKSLFSRIASSPPPAGMEGKAKELEARFKNVVKHTEERLKGLDPILDQVLEFDTLKNQLEDWCLEQQEVIERLPPLEVTEEELLQQQEECQALLNAVDTRAHSVQKLEEIAGQFFRNTEPVQSKADRYARKIQCSVTVRQGSDDQQQPSIGEQANMLMSQFDWLKGRISDRSTQISELVDKLKLFNRHYNNLRKFITEGTELLKSEKPVGDTATRIQEQLQTCQDFREQISAKQPTVDAMLSVGREVLAEPNTSSSSDDLMKKLTSFIEDWSGLQLGWQNWYDELHAQKEQSQQLSDQLGKFEAALQELEPTLSRLFPATVAVKNLDKEMTRLQNKLNSDVVAPFSVHKATLEKLKSEVSLLPDPGIADKTFKKFEDLAQRVEGLEEELSEMVEGVKGWWKGCDGVGVWLSEAEESMVAHKPLASSVDIIEKQRTTVKTVVEGMHQCESDQVKSVKALTDLATHKQVLDPAPIDSYRATLERKWKAMNNDLETRGDLCRCGKEYLTSYANDALPFEAWLKGAESRIKDMVTLPRPRDILLLERDEMKTFCEDMKVHGETLTQLEIRGSSFLGSAKTYQGHLLAFQRRVDPDLPVTPSKLFVDLRTEDLTSGAVKTNDFEGEEYQNGIRVVAGNSANLRQRYDALNAAVKQRQQVVKEGVARRKEFDDCVEIVVGSLNDIEGRHRAMETGGGDSQPLSVQEKVELVRSLEVECIGVEPKLHEVQAKYELLNDLGQGEEDGDGESSDSVWEGEDEAVQDKDKTEHRYRDLLNKLQQQKEILRDELTNAQVFYGAFENFVTWLRITERKTQRDDPLRLEEVDLEKGLKHLQETASDIEAHRPRYEEMCGKCRELIARGVQDGEELQAKLNNVQQRWDAIQVVGEDIKEIEKTLPKLGDFHSTYSGLTSDADALLDKIDGYSVSAVSSDAVKAKSKGLQSLSGEVTAEKSKFDEVVSTSELRETPFDRSQFEKDVGALKEKFHTCDQHLSGKRSELKALEKKVVVMEDLFARFRGWLAKSQMELASLEPSPEDKTKEMMVKQAQSIREDAVDQKKSLETLEQSVEGVLPLLDDSDQETVKCQLEAVTADFHGHLFDCEAFLVEKWVEDREAELVAMAPSAVQVQPLQEELREIQEFTVLVESYRPHMDSLTNVASLADTGGEEGEVKTKMADLQHRYDNLSGLPAQRLDLLEDYLPIVQQYESSRGAWLDLLCGWEEKADQLAPPLVSPASVAIQIDEMKAMLQDVNDHEPEFTSLKRAVVVLCDGPAAETVYIDKLRPLCKTDPPPAKPRPGEQEQNAIVLDYDTRLDRLKKKMGERMEQLGQQLEKSKELETKTGALTSWLSDGALRLADLKIRDPKSSVISCQLLDCQRLAEEMQAKESERSALSPLFSSLTSGLPTENSDCQGLQEKLDSLTSNWEEQAQQLAQQQTTLETALGLANVTEGALGKLNPWVPDTLSHLKSLGPPPAEPELVEQQKVELEGLKVKYNSLAPYHASCMEDGHSLVKVCEEGDPRDDLESAITQHHSEWDQLQKLFGELHEKLTAALAQTQEFQGTAKGLERWMSGMEDLLRQQDRIAARNRLVEPQIEAFQLILDDVDTYSSNLGQATVLGEALMAESNAEEKKKVEDRLASLTSQFQQLQETCQRRMSRLKQALQDSSSYESQCDKFDAWLSEAEGQLKNMPPFSMLTQPLKTQKEKVEEFDKEIESHKSDLTAITKSEEELFATELPSIELCEEHLPSLKVSSTSSLTNGGPPKESSPVVLPDWFDRSGAPEAVEARMDLCKRYDQLKAGVAWLVEVGAEQLGKVEKYEEDYGKLKNWLDKEKDCIEQLPPLPVTVSDIEKQLKEVQEHQQCFANQTPNLESVDMQGTALVGSCQDELSAASGRLALSDLNESWGDAMNTLAQREEELKNRLALATDYQAQLSDFEDWLEKPEEELALPLRLEGDPRALKKQVDAIKRLLSDVEAHQPQMDSLVAAGQALESATGDSSLPEMEYVGDKDRFNKLRNGLNERLSALEEVLGQASSFHDNLTGLLEQLEKMKQELQSQAPPHVMPPAVEAQIKELQVLDKSYCELEPAIAKCKEEGRSFVSVENNATSDDMPPGADIQSLLPRLNEVSAEVRGLLDGRRDQLAASLETAKKFENDSTDLTAWLKEKMEELAGAEAVRGIPEGAKEQLEELKEVQIEVSKQQERLKDLEGLSRSMSATCSTEDSHQLREKMASLTASMEGLQRRVGERKEVLTEGLAADIDFASCWTSCMKEIEEKKEELAAMETVGTDIDTVKTQLEDYKEFEESLSDLKARISSTLARGKKVRESCAAQDKPLLKEQMDRLNAAWSSLLSGGMERKHKLEDALLQLGQFHDALGELLMWIANNTSRLKEARPPGVEPGAVEAQIQDLETIQSGVESHGPSVASLNDAGQKLLASSSAESSADVQRDLASLNENWEELKGLASDRKSELEDAMKKATDFHQGWKCEVDWLEEAELKAYAEWKPCGLVRTCQADLDSHQRFMEDVRSHEAQIEDVKEKGAALKDQGSPEDKKMVDRWVGDLLKRYDDLNFVMEEKKAQLEDASSRAAKFDSLYKSVSESLQKEQSVQSSQQPIHSEVEAVKEQLEQHKDHLKALSELEGQLEELSGWGQLLVKECVVPDGEVIQERLDSLKLQSDTLTSAANERQSALEESLLSLGQFESASDDLWAWLVKANEQLEDFEPITGDPDAVFAQLSKHKALQKQIGARQAGKNAVVRAGKQLMKHKSGDDKALLKKKLQNLEREWEKVCQVSVDRQDKLEEAYMKIGVFRSHIAPLWSWMDKVLPTLDKSDPVHGDLSTVDALKGAQNAFQKDLDSFQSSVDAANESGGHLIGEVLDDPTITKDDLDRLNDAWDDLCQQAAEKQDRLGEAHDQAQRFEDGYNDIVSWISAQVAEQQNQAEPDEDSTVLQQQIDDNKELVQEVAAKQLDYDRIYVEGEGILQLAHPKAVPILETKLQQLERKWLNLRGKIGARSEALASAQLEQHGLQDMLEGLQAWVSDAEKRMSDTEAMPIGTTLDSVEEQLAAHEAFQEEMATQQPNMDALNKAGKKHKVNHTSPELVKKISSLHKHWQKLWLRSSERHRQLLEARTRLKDIAVARSFNFDNWKKRFLSWVDQQKLRVSDLFRRFDSNHDGMLTREEFMKALKASGLAMNQIELEKIADAFDKDRSGMIDLSDIMANLKGGSRQVRRRPVVQEVVSDSVKIDREIRLQVSQCSCEKKFQVTRVAEGQYRFGDNQKLRMVRILRSTVMVRVGGGWEPLEDFLRKHDPCRASGRTNADVRAMLQKGPGLDMSGFTTKTQTSITQKREHGATNGTQRKPTTSTTTVRSATPSKASPKHRPASQTRKTPPPKSFPARSTTPVSTKASGTGASRTPAAAATARSKTPVSSSPLHKSTGRKTAVSPDPTIGGTRRTGTPVSSKSSAAATTSTGGSSKATGSRIPVPSTSKIPTASSKSSRIPTKHT